MNQPAVSKLERADDMSLSRLRNAVEALGGELEVGIRIDGVLFRFSFSNECRPEMRRTIQEILDHQEELADKLENFDPDRGIERPIEEYLEARRLTAELGTPRT